MSDPPVYQRFDKPAPAERFVQDSIDWLEGCFDYAFRRMFLEYWLLDRRGQAYTLFMTTLLGVSIWLLVLHYDSETTVALDPAKVRAEDNVAEGNVVDGEEDQNARTQPSPARLLTLPRQETPIMRKLAPAGHRPINAPLEGSPFRVVQPLGPRPRHLVPPGYQAPSSANSRLSKAFSTRPLHRDNFSDLAQDTPVSSKTLEGTSRLNANGTPKKWEAEQGVLDVLGLNRKDKGMGSPVIAHWSNEGIQRRGRATLRRQLDNTEFA